MNKVYSNINFKLQKKLFYNNFCNLMGPSFMSCTEESHATPQTSMAVFVELGQTLTEKKKKGRPNNQPYPISKLLLLFINPPTPTPTRTPTPPPITMTPITKTPFVN